MQWMTERSDSPELRGGGSVCSAHFVFTSEYLNLGPCSLCWKERRPEDGAFKGAVPTSMCSGCTRNKRQNRLDEKVTERLRARLSITANDNVNCLVCGINSREFEFVSPMGFAPSDDWVAPTGASLCVCQTCAPWNRTRDNSAFKHDGSGATVFLARPWWAWEVANALYVLIEPA